MEEAENNSAAVKQEKEGALVDRAYAKMDKVRVTFRTEGVGIANSSKY